MLAQQFVNALSLGSIYALFALGFTLIFGILGILNLSHGGVFMLGAYAALALLERHWPAWLAFPGAIVLSGLAGTAIDLLLLRVLRRRKASHLMPIIVTIGAAILLTSLAQGLFGAEARRFPLTGLEDLTLQWGEVSLPWLQVMIIVLSLLLMVGLNGMLRWSKLGLALRAIAESPRAAALLGIPVERMLHWASFIAAALGGAAGILIGLSFNAISPFMGQPMLHKGIAAIILGGLGDVRGAALGGLFLGITEVLAVTWLSSDYRDAFSFGLLFMVLLIRPQGLFGRAQIRGA